jgi:hypothetical protein
MSRAGRLLESAEPPFWFSPGFNPEVKAWIMSHRFTNIFADEWNLDCTAKSATWAKMLYGAGFPVERMEGYYDGHYHSWCEVSGQIFDPTATQFDVLGPVQQDKYQNGREMGF